MADNVVVLSDEAWQWMTDELRGLLAAIKPPHAAKKRTTVIKVAFARANEQPLRGVFEQADVCAEAIWYQKWKEMPDVKAAYEACYRRALEWADEETAAFEAHYRRRRRQSVAKLAADAPGALAEVMKDAEQRGSDRISAANALMTWADPEAAGKAQPPAPAAGGDAVTIGFGLSKLGDEELGALLDNLSVARGDG